MLSNLGEFVISYMFYVLISGSRAYLAKEKDLFQGRSYEEPENKYHLEEAMRATKTNVFIPNRLKKL